MKKSIPYITGIILLISAFERFPSILINLFGYGDFSIEGIFHNLTNVFSLASIVLIAIACIKCEKKVLGGVALGVYIFMPFLNFICNALLFKFPVTFLNITELFLAALPKAAILVFFIMLLKNKDAFIKKLWFIPGAASVVTGFITMVIYYCLRKYGVESLVYSYFENIIYTMLISLVLLKISNEPVSDKKVNTPAFVAGGVIIVCAIMSMASGVVFNGDRFVLMIAGVFLASLIIFVGVTCFWQRKRIFAVIPIGLMLLFLLANYFQAFGQLARSFEIEGVFSLMAIDALVMAGVFTVVLLIAHQKNPVGKFLKLWFIPAIYILLSYVYSLISGLLNYWSKWSFINQACSLLVVSFYGILFVYSLKQNFTYEPPCVPVKEPEEETEEPCEAEPLCEEEPEEEISESQLPEKEEAFSQKENEADTLRHFKKLLEEGLITQEDYDKKKKELLDL